MLTIGERLLSHWMTDGNATRTLTRQLLRALSLVFCIVSPARRPRKPPPFISYVFFRFFFANEKRFYHYYFGRGGVRGRVGGGGGFPPHPSTHPTPPHPPQTWGTSHEAT